MVEHSMDLGIDGNAALVTASSSGLGKASAKVLARDGPTVVSNGAAIPIDGGVTGANP